MNVALYYVAKNDRTSVTWLILELKTNTLFELVEMICIRIIKGKLMKISKKIYGIFTTICALCPIIHASSCHKLRRKFSKVSQIQFFILKKWP